VKATFVGRARDVDAELRVGSGVPVAVRSVGRRVGVGVAVGLGVIVQAAAPLTRIASVSAMPIKRSRICEELLGRSLLSAPLRPEVGMPPVGQSIQRARFAGSRGIDEEELHLSALILVDAEYRPAIGAPERCC
jgi:hypothetical protein